MLDVVQSSSRGRRLRLFGAAVLLAGLAVGCGRVDQVEVRASAPPTSVEPFHVPASTLGPTTSFQGAVTALDGAAGEMVVAVHIVWTPILKAESQARRVLLDPATRWEPTLDGLSQVIIGDEVQVDALDVADGPWRALRVRLLDID